MASSSNPRGRRRRPGRPRAALTSVPQVTLMVADPATFRLLSTRYPSFAWAPDRHADYLDAHDDAIEQSRRDGTPVRAGRFDHEEYSVFCAAEGLPPDSAESRSAYAVWAGGSGAAREWEGSVRDLLLSATFLDAVEQGPGDRVEEAIAVARVVVEEVTALMVAAPPGPGSVTVTVGVPGADATVLFPWTIVEDSLQVSKPFDVLFTAVAAGVVHGGGLVVRARTGVDLPDGIAQTRVLGWRLGDHDAVEISEAELFNAFCTDAVTGDLLAPEYGTVYGRGV